MKFSSFLKEMKVQMRPLTDDEKRYARRFQEVNRIFYDYQQNAEEDNFEQFEALVDKLEEYKQEPWMGRVLPWLQKREGLIKKHREEQEEAKGIDKQRVLKNGMRALSMDAKALIAFGRSKDAKYWDYSGKGRPILYRQKHLSSPFYKEGGGGIFRVTGFLQSYTDSDILEVIEKDLDKAYTSIDFPTETEDYEYVVYWFLKLKESDKEIEVQDRETSKYLKMKYINDPDYQTLLDNVEAYLSKNNTNALKAALRGMRKYPELIKKMKQKKQEIDFVYRGIKDNRAWEDEETYLQPSNNDVLEMDRKRGLVATTTSKMVAYTFAQFQGAQIRRPSFATDGWVITYAVEPKDIILDTDIFGGIYSEREIIINSKTARVENIEFYEGFDDEDY